METRTAPSTALALAAASTLVASAAGEGALEGLGDTTREMIALDRPQLERAHAQMLEWVRGEQRRVALELSDERAALESAIAHHWDRKPFRRKVAQLEARTTFLGKLEEALLAGYVLVPNFDMDVFAIRTTARAPRGGETTNRFDQFLQPAQLLPPRVGEYRNPAPAALERTDRIRSERDPKEVKEVTKYWPHAWAQIEFPMAIARPALMNRAGEVMAQRLFDELGVARDTQGRGRRAGDPFLLGRIRNPSGRADVTFFLGWYFDPSAL